MPLREDGGWLLAAAHVRGRGLHAPAPARLLTQTHPTCNSLQEALNDLLAIQPAAASHSAGIAAMDRQGHGLGGQGEEGGKGKGSRRLRLA